MKVAVTGAGGFIGRRIATELAARGHDVTAFTHRATDTTPGLDVTEPKSLDALAGHAAVVHAAAYVPTDHTDAREAQRCLEVNAIGTLSVLEASRRHAIAQVVVLSGGNLYRAGVDPVDEHGPIDPSHRAVYYLTSKACADFYASHFDRAGLATCILRPSSVYGPGIARSMIRAFTVELLAGKPIRVDDGGRYRADLVEVDDVARATADVIARRVRGPLNIGGGVTTSALEIAEHLARLCDAPRELVSVMPASSTAPGGFAPLDISRARETIGYVPTSIADGLARYVAHCRGQR